MDDQEFEEKALKFLVEHGGIVDQKEFTKYFATFFESGDKDERRERFKKVIDPLVKVKRRGESKILMLKDKYRLENHLPIESPVHGLKSSIMQAISKSVDETEENSGGASGLDSLHMSADDLLGLIEKDLAKSNNVSKEESDIGVLSKSSDEIAVDSGGGDMTESVMRRLSESSSLAKMIKPLEKSVSEEAPMEKEKENDREESQELSTAISASESIDSMQQLGDALPLSTAASVVSQSETDIDALLGNETIRPPRPIQNIAAENRVSQSIKDKESPQLAHKGTNGRPVSATGSVSSVRSGKVGKKGDDDSDSVNSSKPLTPSERQWTLIASSVDYSKMRDMLKDNPELAGKVSVLDGSTALHYAAKRGHMDAIRLLVNSSHVDLNKQSGYTPLHRAAMQDHKEAMDLLLSLGADPQIRDYSGRLPDSYLNNAFNTRKPTKEELRQPRTGTTSIHSSDLLTQRASTKPQALATPHIGWTNGFASTLSNGNNGLEAQFGGGFSRMGSIRRAGVAAMNMIRGHTPMQNGASRNSPVGEEAITPVVCRKK